MLFPDLLLLLPTSLPLSLLLLLLPACVCGRGLRTVGQSTSCNEIRASHASAPVARDAAAANGATTATFAAAAAAAVSTLHTLTHGWSENAM